MAIELVVTEPFEVPGDKFYMHGDTITDPSKIATVLAGWPSHVVKRTAEAVTADASSTEVAAAPAETVVTFDAETDTEKAKAPKKA